MADRNRAEGWKHAKLTGHENEALLEALVENNGELQDRLLECGKHPDAVIEDIDFGGLSKLTVEKFMTKKVVTVSENEVVEEAARIMVDNEIGCVPVMKNDLVVGIVTESDLFHLFTDMFGARYSGVRATLSLDDKPGQLVKIVTQIAELKGNIVSVVTQESKDSSQRKITIKATGVTQNQMEQIFASLGVVPEDLRII